MAKIYTGELRAWDSLTPEEQQSGEWIKVPDGTEGGHARPRSVFDALFGQPDAASVRERLDANDKVRRSFDALGKPR